MIDAALIQECADPSLQPAIVEQFIEQAGAPDPLAITVRSGNRMILVPQAETPEQALEIAKDNIGRAVVRVGFTQMPLGIGVADISALTADLFDPCTNIRQGTAQFSMVLRVVSNWYGNPNTEETFPQIFGDAIYAWKTGTFEGENVFQMEDPGGTISETVQKTDRPLDREDLPSDLQNEMSELKPNEVEGEPAKARMRIDLSRIGGN